MRLGHCYFVWVISLFACIPMHGEEVQERYVDSDGFRVTDIQETDSVLARLTRGITENLGRIRTVSGTFSATDNRLVTDPVELGRTSDGPVMRQGAGDVVFQVDQGSRSARTEFRISTPATYHNTDTGESWTATIVAPSFVTVINPTESFRFYLNQAPGPQQGDPAYRSFNPTGSKIANLYISGNRINEGLRTTVTSNPMMAYEGNCMSPNLKVIPKTIKDYLDFVDVGVSADGTRVRIAHRFINGNGISVRYEFDLTKGVLSSYDLMMNEDPIEQVYIEYRLVGDVWFPNYRSVEEFSHGRVKHSETLDLKSIEINKPLDGMGFTSKDLGLVFGDRVISHAKDDSTELHVAGKDLKLKTPADWVAEDTPAGRRRSLSMSLFVWLNWAAVLGLAVYLLKRLSRQSPSENVVSGTE